MQGPSPGSILAHYRIISKLGAGGMGEVYLAQDTKLNRRVALKILPRDEKDLLARDGRLTTFRWETQFEPLRDDPRFKDLLKRMNLPE
jgi:serine/threonine protein kinase